MATYGSRDKNQFLLPSVESKEKYYTLVNPDTYEITVKRISNLVISGTPGAENLDATVGTIASNGPNKGKLIPGPGATPTEKLAFSQQPQVTKVVKDKATETSIRAQTDAGVSLEAAKKRTNEGFENGKATTTTSGDSPSGETPIDLSESQTNLDKLETSISGSDKTRKPSEYPDNNNLRYPFDLKIETQDCITFTMLEYTPRKINLSGIAQGDPLSGRGDRTKSRGKTVTLPIQPSISDSNTVNWGQDEMNAGQLIAAAAALGTITEGSEGAAASVKGITDLFKGSAESLKTAFAAGFADKAAGTKGLLTRVTGAIVNPNMELLFNGPQLRNFSFSFTLSARDPKEAKIIRNIIRFFKQGMSVKRASTGLFLKSPHTFEIKYLHKGNEHQWINKIKECALTGCNVNYTPAGNYATYYDGSMTSYEISLTFGELEPIYDDDYGKGSTSFDTEIGY